MRDLNNKNCVTFSLRTFSTRLFATSNAKVEFSRKLFDQIKLTELEYKWCCFICCHGNLGRKSRRGTNVNHLSRLNGNTFIFRVDVALFQRRNIHNLSHTFVKQYKYKWGIKMNNHPVCLVI